MHVWNIWKPNYKQMKTNEMHKILTELSAKAQRESDLLAPIEQQSALSRHTAHRWDFLLIFVYNCKGVCVSVFVVHRMLLKDTRVLQPHSTAQQQGTIRKERSSQLHACIVFRASIQLCARHFSSSTTVGRVGKKIRKKSNGVGVRERNAKHLGDLKNAKCIKKRRLRARVYEEEFVLKWQEILKKMIFFNLENKWMFKYIKKYSHK